jgi:hypothetical protein
MLRRSKFSLGFLVLVVSLIFGLSSPVYAATSPSSGISLSPFTTQLNLDQGDTQKTFDLTVTNHTSSLQELDMSVEDFGSLNDTGGILLEGSNSYTQRYGLVSWLTLGTNSVVLRANESATVPVTINNRSDLQPGGHYGAVIARVNSLGTQSGNKVTINQQLLSLVIIDKVGGEHFALNLDKISQNGNWIHLPSTVELQFQNPGNVQVTPRGIVDLESPNGTVISKGIINTGSAFILSDSFYNMYVPLTPVGHSLPLPGLYKVVVHYRYDQVSNYATKTSYLQFISLGMYLFIAVVLIVGLIIAKKYKKRKSQKTKTTE